MTWVNTIVQGVLLGGLYALFATGLSLIFGVMGVVNLAHGVLTLLASYIALIIVEATGINPLLAIAFVVPVMFVLGYVAQRALINPTLDGGPLPPLLVTFGLAIILENTLLEIFTADSQGLHAGPIERASIEITNRLSVGWMPVIIFLAAVVLLGCLQLFFDRTLFGRALRATADDRETARLMSIDDRSIYGIAMGIALAIAGVAGVFTGVRTTFGPLDGPTLLIFAFEAVIIGGLGSLWGTLLGGVILGVAQSVGAQLAPGWFQLAGHVVFLTVLALRPEGLFPRAKVRA
jgi:branched-chain amino acid transport system permease protein